MTPLLVVVFSAVGLTAWLASRLASAAVSRRSPFTGEGRVTDEQPLFSGGAAPIDPNALSGPHENQLPLNLEVIGFPN